MVGKFIFSFLLIGSGTAGWETPRCFYNPSTVISKSGVILEISIPEEYENLPVTAIFLSTDGDTFLLRLAPRWFNPDIQVGDSITLRGSLNEIDSLKIILPCKVKKKNREYILRDETGFPLWRLRGRNKK
jgi:hypothetical protein